MVMRVVLVVLAIGVLVLALRYSVWFLFLIPVLAIAGIAMIRGRS